MEIPHGCRGADLMIGREDSVMGEGGEDTDSGGAQESSGII